MKKKFVKVPDIKKPLSHSLDDGAPYVGVRDKYIYEAIRLRIPIFVSCEEWKGYFDPKRWCNTGVKMKPKVFKFPNKPMQLYANYVRGGSSYSATPVFHEKV